MSVRKHSVKLRVIRQYGPFIVVDSLRSRSEFLVPSDSYREAMLASLHFRQLNLVGTDNLLFCIGGASIDAPKTCLPMWFGGENHETGQCFHRTGLNSSDSLNFTR